VKGQKVGSEEEAQYFPRKTVKILRINNAFLCKIMTCFKMHPVKSGAAAPTINPPLVKD